MHASLHQRRAQGLSKLVSHQLALVSLSSNMSRSAVVRRSLLSLAFVLVFWGSLVVLTGHHALLYSLHRISTSVSEVAWSASSKKATVGPELVVGDQSRFRLVSTWDIAAAPTTRVYNWSTSVFFMSIQALVF